MNEARFQNETSRSGYYCKINTTASCLVFGSHSTEANATEKSFGERCYLAPCVTILVSRWRHLEKERITLPMATRFPFWTAKRALIRDCGVTRSGDPLSAVTNQRPGVVWISSLALAATEEADARCRIFRCWVFSIVELLGNRPSFALKAEKSCASQPDNVRVLTETGLPLLPVSPIVGSWFVGTRGPCWRPENGNRLRSGSLSREGANLRYHAHRRDDAQIDFRAVFDALYCCPAAFAVIQGLVVFADDRKVDGQPFEEIVKEVIARIL